MTLPSTFEPLFTRMKEVLEQGLGTDVDRLIASGLLDGSYVREGLEQRLKWDVIRNPQITFDIIEKTNPELVDANQDNLALIITVRVTISVRLHSEVQRERWEQTKNEFHYLSKKVISALRNPTNLETTEGGTDTGLSSGLLTLVSAREPIYDWENKVVTIQTDFRGTIWMNH